MDSRKLALALPLLLVLARPAAPQDAAQEALRHDVVVTATRVETPEKGVGSSITVITAEELLRTRRTSVVEALEAVLGLSVLQNGGRGAAASVMVRGAGSEHTLVLLDGVEINDPVNPARSCDLAHLALSQIERIEVLRGPQGLLYGSDALGGVINIITRSGRGRPRLSLAASADSYQTLSTDLSLAGSSQSMEYALSVFHERTAGISAASAAYPGNVERDGYRGLTVAGRVAQKLGSSARLTIGLRAVQDRTELDLFGGPGGDDPNSVQDYGALFLTTQLRALAAAGRWESVVSLSWTGARRDNDNPADDLHPQESDSGLYRSALLKLDWQNNLRFLADHTVTAGLELETERARSEYRSVSPWGTYESLFPTASARSAGLYLLDHWQHRDRLFIMSGLRVDLHSRSGAAATFRVAPAWLFPRTGTRLKASLGTGFKTPSLYQLYAPATAWGTVGNPDLRPERVLGWDAGVEQSLSRDLVVLGLVYFESSFRDLIQFDPMAGYLNIGRARTRGLELSAELMAASGLRLRAAYTRLSARDLDSGEALLRRSRDKLSVELLTRLFHRIDLALTGSVVGPRLDRDFSASPYPIVELPHYVLLGAAASLPIGPGASLFARLDNILGTRYEPIWGYGAPGFTLRAGVQFGH